jgi:hypothetical protein
MGSVSVVSYAFLLYATVSVLYSTILSHANDDRICNYDNKTFTECSVMFVKNWTACDGKGCPIGHLQRLKGICCVSLENDTENSLKERCEYRCNLTDEDFRELASANITATDTTRKPLTNSIGKILEILHQPMSRVQT